MGGVSSRRLGKVTAFVVRSDGDRRELLLFRHPHAGVQLPAGTIESGENPEEAALREVREETGLELSVAEYLGREDEDLSSGLGIVLESTPVYSRPGRAGFDWAALRPGIRVELLRKQGESVQIRYSESDQEPCPSYVTYSILGWVPAHCLAKGTRRHFFRVPCTGSTPQQWIQHADSHDFQVFWAPFDHLPSVVPPQDRWLRHLGVRAGAP